MVWNTRQSATYQTECCFDKRAEHGEEVRGKPRSVNCAEQRAPVSKGLFDDGDMLLVLGLLMILMRENADRKLLFALLLAVIM